MSQPAFWELLIRVYEGMLHNIYFPKPLVDLAQLKAKMDQYSAAMAATMGGAKIAFAQRDSLREDLEKMLLMLGAYVEDACDNDENIARTSGFDLQPSSR